jgi:phospholipid-binding lipoprotein MlaA
VQARLGLLRGAALGLLAAVAITLLAGCASIHGQRGTSDPLEPVNRPVSVFNQKFDDYVFGPAAHYYVDITPKVVRTGVSHFFSNVAYPDTIVNDFFQAKLVQGVADTGRFIVNSTAGLGGLFDVARHIGLEKHHEDLGQTLGVWGSGSGPYLVLPVFGPSDFRDAPGLAFAALINPLFYVPELYITVPLSVLNAVNTRANLEGVFRLRKQAALDSYSFTRSAYLQHRRFVIYDGNPPTPSSGSQSVPPPPGSTSKPSKGSQEVPPPPGARTKPSKNSNSAPPPNQHEGGQRDKQ